MRVGEELKVMTDDVIRDILLENENDFSAEICPAATLDDLDAEIIENLRVVEGEKMRIALFRGIFSLENLNGFGI